MKMKKITHSDALLFATAENVHPIGHGIPSAIPFLNVCQFDQVQVGEQVVVTNAPLDHVVVRIRINDLVSQRSQGHVRTLRDVKQFAGTRLGQRSTKNRPQLQSNMQILLFGHLFSLLSRTSPKTRKSDDLPHPLGPHTKTFMPECTSNDISSMSMSPLGVTNGTWSK